MKAIEDGERVSGEGGGGEGGTVVVGVKLDEHSKELLTWALVKVAQTGDRVIALHVIKPTAANAGKSTLLSLVKSFDSVLAAYEGFCNLKQVDLKLKVCRGSSVRETLVQEARSYASAKVIVGASRTPHTIRSMVSVAKYCARKLPKDHWVLGVANGKVAYQKKARLSAKSLKDDDKHRSLVLSIHQSLRKNSKVLRDVTGAVMATKLKKKDSASDRKWKLVPRRDSWLTSPTAVPLLLDSSSKSNDGPSEDDVDNSMALVPVENLEATPTSYPLVTNYHQKFEPGCQLIRRMILPNRQTLEKFSAKKISVGSWLPRSPSRHCSAAVYPDQKQHGSKHADGYQSSNGAIVPLGLNGTFLQPSCSWHSERVWESLREKYSSTCRIFSYEELLSLTSNFMPEQMVGKGGNSEVYKGCLPDGRELAVKALKQSENALKEFISEIDIISALQHENILSLYGFCFEGNNLLLVYNYMSRGSLEENLHGSKKDEILFGWNERYKVALGVAEALNYLHHGIREPIIHRDVKSSNILLLDNFEPQLSDFGLATLASNSSSSTGCTDVAGTFGYLAPEYFTYVDLDEKVDVYAYGVVLLELLSGRKPIISQDSLVTWAKPILKSGKFLQLLDTSLESNYDHDQIERMVLATTLCIRRQPHSRPQISQVLKLFQGDTEVINWARQEISSLDERDALRAEVLSIDIQSHLSLALQGLEDDAISCCSSEPSISVEDYLNGRWSRSSSFD